MLGAGQNNQRGADANFFSHASTSAEFELCIDVQAGDHAVEAAARLQNSFVGRRPEQNNALSFKRADVGRDSFHPNPVLRRTIVAWSWKRLIGPQGLPIIKVESTDGGFPCCDLHRLISAGSHDVWIGPFTREQALRWIADQGIVQQNKEFEVRANSIEPNAKPLPFVRMQNDHSLVVENVKDFFEIAGAFAIRRQVACLRCQMGIPRRGPPVVRQASATAMRSLPRRAVRRHCTH